MLTLMLLRHAKAVPQARGDDYARDLQPQGRDHAARLGHYLAERGLVPDFALVSGSARTRQTYEALTGAIDRPVAARFEASLYNATMPQLRDLMRIVDPVVERLMVIGHNPGIADAAVALSRDGDPAEIARMRARFAPCALAVLGFDTGDWLDARAAGGRLDLFLLPEDLSARP